MEEEQYAQDIIFADIKKHEAQSQKVLDEIYTRLYHARLIGLELEKRQGNTPLLSEDEVTKDEQEHLDYMLASVANVARDRSLNTELKKIPYHEFIKNGVEIKTAIENNDQSKTQLGADAVFTTTLNGRKITLKIITIDDVVTHAIDVVFPDDDDFEGLAYHSSDTKNGRLNTEDYAIASFVLSKAVHVVYDVNQNS